MEILVLILKCVYLQIEEDEQVVSLIHIQKLGPYLNKVYIYF